MIRFDLGWFCSSWVDRSNYFHLQQNHIMLFNIGHLASVAATWDGENLEFDILYCQKTIEGHILLPPEISLWSPGIFITSEFRQKCSLWKYGSKTKAFKCDTKGAYAGFYLSE